MSDFLLDEGARMKLAVIIMTISMFLLATTLLGCSVEGEGAAQGEVSVVQGEPDGVLDCPRGLVDEPYPGTCGFYHDENDDGICDHSQ